MNDIPKLSISALFPAYNDESSIATLVVTAIAILTKYSNDFEVIVVDDGSRDKTAEILENLRVCYSPRVRIVTHPENRGYGAALRSGFATASKDFIFYTDGDGQYDVGELPHLLRLMGPEVGLVNGYKIKRRDPRHRIVIGQLYNRFAKWLFHINLRDIDCDYRLIRRRILCLEEMQSTSGTICVELVHLIESGPWMIVETGVNHYRRLSGKSQFFRVWPMTQTLFQLLALYCRLIVFPAASGTLRRAAG